MLDTETLDGFKGAVNRRLRPRVCFSVFRDVGGVVKAIYEKFCFLNWECAVAFNNNNKGTVGVERTVRGNLLLIQ